MMTAQELISMAKKALSCKTLYVSGCWGAPMSTKLGPRQGKNRYLQNNAYNKAEPQNTYIRQADEDTFGFDCCNLIKGIVWGWNADKNAIYGGAGYKINGCDDLGADALIVRACYDVSSDFSNIQPGEMVWMQGHVGIYIGDGECIEATGRWEHKVLKSVVLNVKNTPDIHRRTWSKHGKLKFIDYGTQAPAVKPQAPKEQPKEAGGDVITYKVKKGDVLSKIAAAYNTTPDKIVERNKESHKKISRNFICTGWNLEIKVGEK